MAERGFLVITHGEFGIAMIKSAEMIMGPQENAKGLGLRPGEAVEDLRTQAVEIVEKNTADGKETIVLCDLLGGSPSNVALFLLSKGVKHVATGVNLPMLIELFSTSDFTENTEELLENVKKSATEGVRLLDISFLQNKQS